MAQAYKKSTSLARAEISGSCQPSLVQGVEVETPGGREESIPTAEDTLVPMYVKENTNMISTCGVELKARVAQLGLCVYTKHPQKLGSPARRPVRKSRKITYLYTGRPKLGTLRLKVSTGQCCHMSRQKFPRLHQSRRGCLPQPAY